MLRPSGKNSGHWFLLNDRHIHPPESLTFESTSNSRLLLIDVGTMHQDSCGYLSARPAFLPRRKLSYDGLPKSPKGFAGRLCGRAFRSVEGGEAPRSYVLQRRIFLPVECLFAGVPYGCAVSGARREACNHLSFAYRRARLCPAVGWGADSSRPR